MRSAPAGSAEVAGVAPQVVDKAGAMLRDVDGSDHLLDPSRELTEQFAATDGIRTRQIFDCGRPIGYLIVEIESPRARRSDLCPRWRQKHRRSDSRSRRDRTSTRGREP